jgi:lysophospholipase L1-like esterase
VSSKRHADRPSTRIVLLGILPSHVSDGKSRANAAVNAYLSEHYAHLSDVTYLDVSPVFLRDGRLQEELLYDPRLKPARGALHTDTAGQRLMAEAIEAKLAELMSH